jgi:hypothetical protein
MRQFVDCPIDGLLVTWHHPMKFFFPIGCLIALGSTAFPQQNSHDYLQHLVGQPLIFRHYGSSANPSEKASVVRAKAAMRGHFKTGHMEWPGT